MQVKQFDATHFRPLTSLILSMIEWLHWMQQFEVQLCFFVFAVGAALTCQLAHDC